MDYPQPDPRQRKLPCALVALPPLFHWKGDYLLTAIVSKKLQETISHPYPSRSPEEGRKT